MQFVVGGAVVAALVALVLWLRGKQQDQAITAALFEIHAEARRKLSVEDLQRLQVQLYEVQAIGRQAHQNGMSARAATRMGEQAAIQCIASFIEIERMFPGSSDKAA